jgi:hypothetical protein
MCTAPVSRQQTVCVLSQCPGSRRYVYCPSVQAADGMCTLPVSRQQTICVLSRTEQALCLAAVNMQVHLQGIQLKTEPRPTASLKVLHFRMKLARPRLGTDLLPHFHLLDFEGPESTGRPTSYFLRRSPYEYFLMRTSTVTTLCIKVNCITSNQRNVRYSAPQTTTRTAN